MTDETPDNPPAFPTQREGPWTVFGMTLRDYFAASALNPAYYELARQVGEGELSGFGWDAVAASAYRIADAMLAKRAKAGR